MQPNYLQLTQMFKRILVANRGEIALRIIRACQELNIETVAVYSTADRDAEHVRCADHAICIGESAPSKSYLNASVIISAAELVGADAIHPGYGFLAENALFAEMCEASGFHFIGPKPESISLMGDKISAIKALKPFGIEPVPGSSDFDSDKSLAQCADAIGYPVLIKSAFAGGGRGMRIVTSAKELPQAMKEAELEAEHACQNRTVYVEKYLESPRHIEFQVLSDAFGNVLILGERDCSIQRRYQKIIEEAPALNLPDDQLKTLHGKITKALQSLSYIGAGTLEFLYQDGHFYFIEMNTRLQVEHPVTEEIFDVDIVKEQINIASGHTLSIINPKQNGHAIECRIVAEDPVKGIPSPGVITQLRLPGGPGVRIESDLYQGQMVSPYYDPMICKIVVHAKTRDDAIKRMQCALSHLLIEGISTNREALIDIIQQSWYKNLKSTTHSLNSHFKAAKDVISS